MKKMTGSMTATYDISCTAMSWDNVDEDWLRVPRKWDASGISRFMLWNGPVSSVFDIVTFGVLYFVICPACMGGQLFSRISGQEGRASAPVTLLSLAGIAAATCLPFTPLGGALGLAPLPAAYFAWLAAIVAGYMALATAVKKLYMRRYGEWL